MRLKIVTAWSGGPLEGLLSTNRPLYDWPYDGKTVTSGSVYKNTSGPLLWNTETQERVRDDSFDCIILAHNTNLYIAKDSYYICMGVTDNDVKLMDDPYTYFSDTYLYNAPRLPSDDVFNPTPLGYTSFANISTGDSYFTYSRSYGFYIDSNIPYQDGYLTYDSKITLTNQYNDSSINVNLCNADIFYLDTDTLAMDMYVPIFSSIGLDNRYEDHRLLYSSPAVTS